jgi:hypothetical protein
VSKYKYGDKIECAYVGCDRQFEYQGTTRKYCSCCCQLKAEQLDSLIKRRTKPKIIISCKKCNKEFKKTYKFCPYCGGKLEVQELIKSQQEIQEITDQFIERAESLSKDIDLDFEFIEIDDGIFL